MSTLTAVTMLAWLTEWLAERFFGSWLKGHWMIAVATVIGVALCVLFRVDGLAMLGLPKPIGSPWTGEFVTGIIVGAGSDFVHSLYKKTGRTI